MGSYLTRDDMPSNYELFLYSDVHVGTRAFHEEAFKEFVSHVKAGKNRFAICGGDLAEAQSVDHPHYQREAVYRHDPGRQYDDFEAMIAPIASRHIGILTGNHDWRWQKVKNFVRDQVCKNLGIPYLGSRTYVTLNGINIFYAHKGPMLPRGAKDPHQRRANREAALQRHLEPQWSSAHLMAYGDIHQLLVKRPLPDYWGLVGSGDGIRMRPMTYHEIQTPEGVVVDPHSRFYAVTGTFRRSGALVDAATKDAEGYSAVYDDYSDNFNYTPLTLGYVKAIVKDDRIVDVVEVPL